MLYSNAVVRWLPEDGNDHRPHPTEICECENFANTSLPKLYYRMKWDGSEHLSTFQEETIKRIFQAFNSHGAFLLGDATGMGKGRVIAAVLHECKAICNEFSAVWVSVNSRLRDSAIYEIDRLGTSDISERNLIFTSYAAMLDATRVARVQSFLRPARVRIIILDECHMLRNMSFTAQIIRSILASDPKCLVLYSSATPASSPRHLQYWERLGMWGAGVTFENHKLLYRSIRMHGTCFLELLSMQMYQTGVYVSRQLSMKNISVHMVNVVLSAADKQLYNTCAQHLRAQKLTFGSVPQYFFQQLITAMKTRCAIEVARQQLAVGDAVVFSLIATGDAAAKRRQTLDQKVGDGLIHRCGMEHIQMPSTPIQQIIDAFGHSNVAELTGRTFRTRLAASGGRERYPREGLKDEITAFQSGKKRIAILSRAGGVGISLHDDTLGIRRCHIVLELPWGAEDFVQQLGRTYRANTITYPHYYLCRSDLPAESRFYDDMQSKLSSMGALVKGDKSLFIGNRTSVTLWSTSTCRSIGLYLAAARAWTLYNEGCLPLPSCTRTEARELISDGRVNVTAARLKTDMICKLCKETNLYTIGLLLGAAKILYAEDVFPLMYPWDTRTHCNYPLPFRRRVFTILCCHRVCGDRNAIGLLPGVLLHEIFGWMAKTSTVMCACEAATTFKQLNLDLETLAAVPKIRMLNRILGMEVRTQECLFDYATLLSTDRSLPSVTSISSFAQERAGPRFACIVESVTAIQFPQRIPGVRVTVAYTIHEPVIDPPSNCVWVNHRTQQALCVDTGRLFFSNGLVRKDIVPEVFLLQNGYTNGGIEDWTKSVYHHLSIARRHRDKLENEFDLAIGHQSMSCWKESMHRVLHIPMTANSPRGAVGLLMRVNRVPPPRRSDV